MAQQTKATLQSWFKKGLKPLQQQFYDWMDSFWHKDESIPISSVTNLQTTLNSLGVGGAAIWGGITGTLANQTDLKNALDAKAAVLDVGDKTTLITTDKASLVAASNEIKGNVNQLQSDGITLSIFKVSNYATL
jgi:hypothetical protein